MSNNLVKLTKNRNKKNLFDELSFVEDHVNTFYIGLNERNDAHQRAADNPITAKSVDVDDGDWIHPDSQLMSKRHKNRKLAKNNKPPPAAQQLPRPIESKYKALDFVNNELPRTRSESSALNQLFDANTTFANDRTPIKMTSSQCKVFVDDTPVELYGLSRLDRHKRKGGL